VRRKIPFGRAPLALVAAAAAGAVIALLLGACADARKGKAARKDPAVERKLERLVALIMDVERRGAGEEDSAAVEAQRIIAEFGGPDSTARVFADRLLVDAERWIPILDSLARAQRSAPAAIPAPSPAPTPVPSPG
jgi:hypothetical protein